MKHLLTLLFVFLLGAARAQTDSLTFAPANPQPGRPLTISFHPTGFVFTGQSSIPGGLACFNAKGKFNVADLALIRTGDAWTTSVSIPDTATAIVVFVIDPSGKAYAALPAFCYTKDGKAISGGNQGMSYAYSGSGQYFFGVKPDKGRSEEYDKASYEANRGKSKTFQTKMAYQLFDKDTVAMINALVTLPLDTNASEADYRFAVYVAGRVKNKTLGDVLTNVQKTRFPRGDWKKIDFLHKVAAEKDLDAKAALLEEFKRTFPDDASPYYTNMMVSIATSCAIAGDFDRAMRYIPPGMHGSELATLYNNIAWYGSCEKGVHLTEGLHLSMASLDTLKAMEVSLEEKPDFETSFSYKKELENEYGLYADTYAFLLYKTANYKEAYRYEALSMRVSGDPTVDIISRYHMMMEKVEKPSKVLASLSDYIVQGKSDSAMTAQFVRLSGKKGNQSLAVLQAKAKAAKKAEMVKTILSEPASGFVLRDLDGKQVSLDSLRGKTIVLDFWATWCGPCKASFPAMQQIVNNHKQDKNVVLLFIDTWENVDDKKKNAIDFIKQSPYTFHVLMDNDNQVVEHYKVEGIPTKFIIDKDGVLRFKAVGFDGSTDNTVTELESMIELAAHPSHP